MPKVQAYRVGAVLVVAVAGVVLTVGNLPLLAARLRAALRDEVQPAVVDMRAAVPAFPDWSVLSDEALRISDAPLAVVVQPLWEHEMWEHAGRMAGEAITRRVFTDLNAAVEWAARRRKLVDSRRLVLDDG